MLVAKLGVPGAMAYNAGKGVLAGTVLYSALGKPSLELIGLNFNSEEEIMARIAAAAAVILTSVTFWSALATAGVLRIGKKSDVESQPEVSTESLVQQVNQD